ncbi:MAG: hypothetical protein ABFC96_01640 [Thermoguttaceae bacterium]
MSATSSYRRFAPRNRSCFWHITLAVALVATLAASASAQEYIVPSGPGPALGLNLFGGVRSQDSPAAFRDAAKTWGMYQIAVMQAARGRSQDAKHTLWQIDQRPPSCPSEVTGVWFSCGVPIYNLPPSPLALYASAKRPSEPVCGTPASQMASSKQARRPAVAVATATRLTPVGLPTGYLAADPRHGAVVEFSDDRDSRGTRITSRKYADGYVVIETPRAAGLAAR